MEPTTLTFIGILIAVANAWFWYDKSKTDKDIDSHKKQVSEDKKTADTRFINMGKELSQVTQKQTEHDNKFVTDQRVRDIVKDEIKPLKDDVSQMKVDVSKIMASLQELTTELKVNNAIRDYEKSN